MSQNPYDDHRAHETGESEGGYRQIFDSATDMIFVQDAQTGEFLDVNAETLRATGYTLDEFRENGPELFSPKSPDYSPERAMGYVAKAAAGEPQLFEWAFVDRGGRLHPTEVHLKRIEFNGRVCLVGITRDITDRKKAEAEHLELEKKMLQGQKLESLGLLAGGIAHDFNNILMGIIGHSSLAFRKLPEGAAARQHIELLEVAANRAADLVRQMLLISGGGPGEVVSVNLSSLVEEIGNLLSTVVSTRAQLVLELDRDLLPIWGNPSSARQIIMNLITNASEALGGEPGTISLRTGVREMSREDLAATYVDWERPSGAYCYLEVSDTGGGMDAETLSRLFDPFFTSKSFGRGLGLASVLGIVRTMNGAIDVKSGPGEGTRFTVFLPSAGSVDARQPAGPESKESVDLGGSLLIVDDDEMVRKTTRCYLEVCGIDALEAESGEACLELLDLHRERIAAVLLDMTMPGMSGADTLRALRERGWEVPVILCSGYIIPGEELAMQEPYPDAFLAKPFSSQDLISTLAGIIEG